MLLRIQCGKIDCRVQIGSAEERRRRSFLCFHRPELAGIFVEICDLHEPVVFWVTVVNFARFGLHVLSDCDDDSEKAVAMISRPYEILDAFTIAKAVDPDVKVRATERAIHNRLRLAIKTVSSESKYHNLATAHTPGQHNTAG